MYDSVFSVTLKKIGHKTSVEDVWNGKEPSILKEALEQRVSIATRSSISGAEEETSVNGSFDKFCNNINARVGCCID